MAKLCNETLRICQEIFDEAYVLGRNSGTQGIFICPKMAFESFFQEKLAQISEQNVSLDMAAFKEPQINQGWQAAPKESLI